MSRRLLVLWIVLGGAGGVGLALMARHAARAESGARLARARYEAAALQAAELAALRAAAPRERTPGSGLATRVSAVMTRCGLPATALSSLSPEATVAEGRGRRQRAVLTLGSVTLPQLGSFLESWRGAEPDWVVSSIDLSPVAAGGAAPGSDLPLRVVIGIEAVTIQTSEPALLPVAGGGR